MMTNSSRSDSPHEISSPPSERSVRIARNVAEKQRRDKLNAYITDLANTVPLVSSATKRLDKTSILRLSAAYIRLHESPLSPLAQNISGFTSRDENNLNYSPSADVTLPIAARSSSLSSSSFSSASATSCASTSSTLPSTHSPHALQGYCFDTNGNYSSLAPGVHDELRGQIAPKTTSISCSAAGAKGNISRCKRGYFTTNHLKSLIDSIDGFVIVTNNDLNLIYVSQTCEKFLGHTNIDMMGFPIGHFIHPGDCDAVTEILEETKKSLILSNRLMSDRIQFRCRMRERSQPRTEMVTYQMVNISGVFEVCLKDETMKATSSSSSSSSSRVSSPSSSPFQIDSCKPTFSPANSVNPLSVQKRKIDQLEDTLDLTHCKTEGDNYSTRGKRNRSTDSPPSSTTHYTSSSFTRNLLFKGFVQVIASSPAAELSLIDANQEEYVTRMTLDGVFLYADHRLSMVTGYTPSEILGKSAYAYILVPDHVISLFAHKLSMLLMLLLLSTYYLVLLYSLSPLFYLFTSLASSHFSFPF